MKISQLQYITNGNSAEEILTEVKRFIKVGGDWVQLRIKNEKLDRKSIAVQVKKLCKGKAKLIMNDWVDLAKEIDCDGVHLGLTDMPIDQARSIMGNDKIIGGTANTLSDCLNRVEDGADYIGLGPYKMTTTKKKLSPILGEKGYQEILSELNKKQKIPVVAIGGIELGDLKQLAALKDQNKRRLLHGVAASGMVLKAVDVQEVIESVQQEFKD